MTESDKRVAIFVDGEGFIYMLRNLFHPGEFHRADYLPRQAKWGWFFDSIGEALGAQTVQVYWYSIRELDYFPEGNWHRMPFEIAERKLRNFPAIEERLDAQSSKRERKQVVNEFRETIPKMREKMEARLIEWHELQDQITQDSPKVKIRRPGWQACSLVNSVLHEEKAVDVGMVVDMLSKSDDFDIAVLLTADGDFVPAVKELRRRGKENACLYFQGSPTRKGPRIARRLTKEMNYVIDLPIADLAAFMGVTLVEE